MAALSRLCGSGDHLPVQFMQKSRDGGPFFTRLCRSANQHTLFNGINPAMGNLLAWFRDAFWSKEMELSVVGLSNAGKSTLCAAFAIGSGYAMDDMIPTVGFNMRQVKRNNVVMKIWDLGGQSRFKSLWERYCKGVTAIVYVVDASNHEQIDASKEELHELMAKPSLEGIPLLILGNKCDVDGALSADAIQSRLAVETITGRPLVTCLSVSAKVGTGLEECLEWLCNRADEAKR